MASRRIAVAALAWAFAWTGPPVASQAARPNVLLVTIDTLRADYVACFGKAGIETPVLDALAADGTRFTRAYCQAPMTPPSHASILTGVYPPTHGVRDFTSTGLPKGFPTLAGHLKRAGYTTAAFVSAYVLDAVWGLNQGFDLYYDRFTPRELMGANPGNVQRRAGETIGYVLDWLARGPRTPYFLWVHLYDPHHDYNPPEPFKTRYARDPYAGEVAYADRELGRLVEALKARGDYDRTLIVATSDHGEAFGEHEEAEHGFFVYETTARVPLIVKLPRSEGTPPGTFSDIVESVDLAPTILQVTRTAIPAEAAMQGKGLLGRLLGKGGPASRTAYCESLYPRNTFGWSDLASLSEGTLKYIDAPRPELYDLSLDPGERDNLYTRQRAVADGMRRKLATFRSGLRTASASQAPADSQRVEALRALGYVAVAVPVPAGTGAAGLADPKDRVGTFNKVLLAMQASDAGAFDRSNRLLVEVLADDPQLFIGHYSLGVNALKLGDNRAALEHFTRARALNPGFDLTEMNRASALARLGRVDEAIAALAEVVRQNPSRLEPRRQLALLYTRKREHVKAIDLYRQILAERPDDPEATKFLGIAQVEAEQYPDGAKTLARAIALGAADALAHNSLGIALGNLGQVRDAIASYRRALEIKRDYHQARLNLAFALVRAGETAEGRREFDALCRDNPRLCEQYRKYFP
jgi:arylsulfatase A-like enzyme/Flp pilus assembly protein TadD